MKLVEKFFAKGHENVVGIHPMTFEITKDPHLTRRGDCVIAVNATKAPLDFSDEFKNLCRQENTRISIMLEADSIVDLIRGSGNPGLKFADQSDMVGRKSSYVSDRTVMVRADKAAKDLKRPLIKSLKSPGTTLTIHLVAEL